MNYSEFMSSPDIHRAFDKMFEKQRAYYKNVSIELGIKPDQVELFSIKMANISTDLHFTKKFTDYSKKTAAELPEAG